MAIVVFSRADIAAILRLSRGWPRPDDESGPTPPNSSSISNGAAKKCLSPGVVTAPIGFEATRAATIVPSGSASEADPSPPFIMAVSAPVPAPTLPSANASLAASKALRPNARYGLSVQSFCPPFNRSKRIAPGTSGTTAEPTRNPRPVARNPSITPEHASNPNADPPASTSPSTAATVLSGASKSVSRVPGAPPITCTEAVKGASPVTIVTPDFSVSS